MRLEFSPAADADLVEIASFIARDNIPRASTFVDELQASCAMLIDYPHTGVSRSDIRPGLRSKPYGSYVIFYNVLERVIRIERILHGARDIGAVFPPD
ncbi:type II toxin-antitoxin system RelE/ParE family toxin [Sphingobium sp. DEHP117]|uniref:type II toxin-antitoxin system RelE/ParE family toxin n=1 Tax=Sphingobium sp. DEHP117 TaxID=2993436 RepID=UPI0027D5F5F3|nr:type II toxin-antitoxin system RelE/ParE family toxin [Sphingobium sp. DEHP117]MDQ4422133.1 type II toxin-antitoxin system RelE/ParE family toxin [Sphingobium sp. DEHP117]